MAAARRLRLAGSAMGVAALAALEFWQEGAAAAAAPAVALPAMACERSAGRSPSIGAAVPQVCELCRCLPAAISCCYLSFLLAEKLTRRSILGTFQRPSCQLPFLGMFGCLWPGIWRLSNDLLGSRIGGHCFPRNRLLCQP